ncbi:MAG: hypothetical protein NC301_02705 [Bacteroides sp.]|nr:hypothetical protein [Bacteroides sp.]MCM1379642.1 hypothetical protein [Bacteroides sp.]MCM1445976.1 hypothetical protein [Prevotella sp.]
MNKLIIYLLAVTATLLASAQNFVGSWELFPSYSAPAKVIETPEYVYTLTGATQTVGGSLSYYDKTTDEIGAMNTGNRLNGNKVCNMWYDPREKCLFVVFDDYNIDIVYDDGRTISVPDLRDAAISESKLINDVDFANGKAFVALQSGMLVVDLAHGAITESVLWGKNVSHIAASEKKLLIRIGNQLYFGEQAGSHHNFNNSFYPLESTWNKVITNMLYMGNSRIYATDGGRGYVYQVLEDQPFNQRPYYLHILDGHPGVSTSNVMTPTRNGAMTANGTTLNYVNSNGEYTAVTLATANGNKVADWNGNGQAPWLADATGYGKYDVAAKQFAIARMKPRGTSGSNVGRIIQHPLTDDFYLSTAEIHQNKTVYNLAYVNSSYADIYDPIGKSFKVLPANLVSKPLASFEINPLNPNQIFTGKHITMGNVVNLESGIVVPITVENTNMETSGSLKSFQVDEDGNLWMVKWNANSTYQIIKALKGSWENEIKSSGWSLYQVDGFLGNHSSRMILDKDKHIAILSGHNGLAAIQMPEANKPLTSACKSIFHDNSYDADGSSLGGWKYPALAVDKNGWIWIGNDVGVMYVKDSREMFNEGFAVTRPKVARNDGTNLADYLLNQVEIMCIAVDENNHKWIGTLGSGLYCVNEDGTEILEHLTVSNSDIPSNDIFAVCPDRNSNDVYVGTADGLAIYHSTSSPAADDYDDVYAYPNPVTPDFTGHIAISGLKSDSLVKIADASGNVLYETTSNGGMALWDGTDASGRRVRSGVYFVFASQSGENGSGAAVTKIVVIN